MLVKLKKYSYKHFFLEIKNINMEKSTISTQNKVKKRNFNKKD